MTYSNTGDISSLIVLTIFFIALTYIGIRLSQKNVKLKSSSVGLSATVSWKAVEKGIKKMIYSEALTDKELTKILKKVSVIKDEIACVKNENDVDIIEEKFSKLVRDIYKFKPTPINEKLEQCSGKDIKEGEIFLVNNKVYVVQQFFFYEEKEDYFIDVLISPLLSDDNKLDTYLTRISISNDEFIFDKFYKVVSEREFKRYSKQKEIIEEKKRKIFHPISKEILAQTYSNQGELIEFNSEFILPITLLPQPKIIIMVCLKTGKKVFLNNRKVVNSPIIGEIKRLSDFLGKMPIIKLLRF